MVTQILFLMILNTYASVGTLKHYTERKIDMGYSEFLNIENKKGQYIRSKYEDLILKDIDDLIDNFFKAINSTTEYDEYYIYEDNPDGLKLEHWTKIDDGIIPIWTMHGGLRGGLWLTTLEGIKIFLEANGYKDLVAEDIEYIDIGWNC